MIIRETIHHGNYRNVREQDVENTLKGFIALLQASPYNGGKVDDWYRDNEYVRDAADKLYMTGRSEFGWATYEVVPEKKKDAPAMSVVTRAPTPTMMPFVRPNGDILWLNVNLISSVVDVSGACVVEMSNGTEWKLDGSASDVIEVML